LFATRESGVGGTLNRNSVSSAMLRCICEKEIKGLENGQSRKWSTTTTTSSAPHPSSSRRIRKPWQRSQNESLFPMLSRREPTGINEE
jgi:hypothetical protein